MTQTWFDLPDGARDWLRRGELASYWLAPDPTPADELAAWRVLSEWDAVVGRMLRAALFDEHVDPREVRKCAEAIAAVAESLAARLGQTR